MSSKQQLRVLSHCVLSVGDDSIIIPDVYYVIVLGLQLHGARNYKVVRSKLMSILFLCMFYVTLRFCSGLKSCPTSGARFIQNASHSPRRVPGPNEPFSAKQWPKTTSLCRGLHIYDVCSFVINVGIGL
jgi:hypothetical protein